MIVPNHKQKAMTDTAKPNESVDHRGGTAKISAHPDFLYYATAGVGAVVTSAKV
jgi:hypothetical protein